MKTSDLHREGLAYWVESPGVGKLRPLQANDFSDAPSDSLVSLKTLFSGVSPGTESLIGKGLVPQSAAKQMACAGMNGSFELPIKYGYCCVAEAIEGAGENVGKRAFVMHPHQSVISARSEQLNWIPKSIPSRRALLFPNLETALNGVWDAQSAGSSTSHSDTLAIFGAGLVGLLIHFVLSAESETASGGLGSSEDGSAEALPRVILVEPDPMRRERALTLPWVKEAIAPSDLKAGQASIAWHTSATSDGLQSALDAVGFEGTVVDLSWYGTRNVTLELGASFHWLRKRLVSSQVGHVAPLYRASLGYSGRRKAVWDLLQCSDLDLLLSPDIPFNDLPQYMMQLYAGARPHALPVIRY